MISAEVLAIALKLFVVAYLPGALIFRLPIGDRRRRAALSAQERAFWSVIISATLSVLVTLALAAAAAYTFARLIAVNLAISALVAVWGRSRLRYGTDAPRVFRPDLTRGADRIRGADGIRGADLIRSALRVPHALHAAIPILLVALGLWLYLPPSEYVMGGRDPGTYISEGVQIAQQGALVVRDPVVAGVPPSTRDLFFPSHNNPSYYGLRFMGFFIRDPAAGTVVGQFPHLYPASIALGYGVDGLTGARRVSAMWAILGVLALYFVALRLTDATTAAGAAALVAINVVQVWFARYPNSEVVMQALLLAALLAFARSYVDGDPFFGPLAGVLFGSLLFLRYDAVLAVASLGAVVTLGLVNRRRVPRAVAVPLIVALAVWWMYMTGPLAAYASRPFAFMGRVGPTRLVIAAAIALAIVVWVSRRHRYAAFVRTVTPVALSALVIGGALYAYFLRPAAAGGGLANYDAEAFRVFGWYITRAGLALGVAGFALLVRQRFWRDPGLFVTAAAFGLFFFYKTRIVPEHFWMARRFLPIILPAAVLGVLFAVRTIVEWAAERARASQAARLGAAATAIAAVALGWAFWRATEPIRRHVEYAGLIPRLERIAREAGDDDLLLVESRDASDLHVLALPLAYIYARNVLVLNSRRPEPGLMMNFLEWGREKYREVFFLGGGGTDLLSRRVGVSAVTSDRFQIPEYAAPYHDYPRGVRMKEFDFSLYRFVAARAEAGWFTLDVGTMDDLHVVRFHAKEKSGETTFRWTRDVSYVSLAGLTADARLVTLWLGDVPRPPGVQPSRVKVFFQDHLIGEAEVSRGFRAYAFPLPSGAAAEATRGDAPPRLRLESTTWNPRRAMGSPDDRFLGVMVDRVEVR